MREPRSMLEDYLLVGVEDDSARSLEDELGEGGASEEAGGGGSMPPG